MLKIKTEETLHHIEEITKLEASEETTGAVDEAQTLPSKLEEIAKGLEENVTSLIEEINNQKRSRVT
ncbi:hypothetical protein [Bacillus massilinigeriensis]|uniref:hypothetical protein n=1 Tax=Bacillus mediterraneensis TaxID=1805474 RepID=UPI0008F917DD|nr:hypothetical protein [Bacillus mediterraneensis]